MRWIAALALLFLVPGCGEEQPAIDVDKMNPVYSLERGENRRYTVSYVQSVSVRMEDEHLIADRRYDAAFTLTNENEAAAGFDASITLDALDASVVTDVGRQEFDTRNITGNKIAATVSSKGGAPGYPEPGALPTLSIGPAGTPGGEQHISFLFDYAFPRLPSGVAKAGDTWSTTVTRTHLEGNLPVTAEVTTTHQMKEFVTFNGVLCMLVESRISAPLSAVVEEGERVWEYKGRLDGTAHWYFSPGTGALIRLTAREKSQGANWSTEVEAAIKQNTSIEVRLVHDE